MGRDRIDIQFAAEEFSKFFLKPAEPERRTAKVLARYPMDRRAVVVDHKFQKEPERRKVVWSDTGFAECIRKRRRASDGCHVWRMLHQEL